MGKSIFINQFVVFFSTGLSSTLSSLFGQFVLNHIITSARTVQLIIGDDVQSL